LSSEEFEHKGERLEIPPMKMTPRPFQHPHPPIHMVATSMESHRYAGEMGLGCISFDNWLGWDHCAKQATTYKEAIQNPFRPVGAGITNNLCACAITGYCAESLEEAKKTAGWIALTYLAAIAEYTYGRLAKESPDYAYMAETGEELKNIIDNNDLDALMELSPAVLIGTPDDFVQRGRQLEELGFDEITMRIEGMGHENVMRSLELIGKHVIPEFSAPNSIARTPAFDLEIRVP
jgi:alkanesulfonate monooxygenase SsuD/methylene tetrahydromethanopterin reductase-like flavin-dependent oxidoreductase (luciferase family)